MCDRCCMLILDSCSVHKILGIVFVMPKWTGQAAVARVTWCLQNARTVVHAALEQCSDTATLSIALCMYCIWTLFLRAEFDLVGVCCWWPQPVPMLGHQYATLQVSILHLCWQFQLAIRRVWVFASWTRWTDICCYDCAVWVESWQACYDLSRDRNSSCHPNRNTCNTWCERASGVASLLVTSALTLWSSLFRTSLQGSWLKISQSCTISSTFDISTIDMLLATEMSHGVVTLVFVQLYIWHGILIAMVSKLHAGQEVNSQSCCLSASKALRLREILSRLRVSFAWWRWINAIR